MVFSGNSAGLGGGAMYNNGRSYGESSPSLTNVTFSGNSANYGGATYNAGYIYGNSSTKMTNVTFSGNSAYYGGAMYNHGDSFGNFSPTMTNVTFSGNSAEIDGGAIRTWIGVNGKSVPTVHNSILWGNQANGVTRTIVVNIQTDLPSTFSLTHSLVEGSGGSGDGWIGGKYKDGGGNIDVDPLFVEPISPSSAPTMTGNLRLRVGSPAIDAGLNLHTVNTGVQSDLDGEPRFKDGDGDGDVNVDMGAYEADMRYLLSVVKTGHGAGTVTSMPTGIDCGGACSAYFKEDTAVTLTAVPDEGSIFAGWDGACSGAGDCQLELDGELSVSAAFDLKPPEPAFEINLPLVKR
jgi:hypothetical protein